MSKETYHKAKETYSYGKRDLLALTYLDMRKCQKRPIARQKRPIIRQKRPTNTSMPVRLAVDEIDQEHDVVAKEAPDLALCVRVVRALQTCC